MEQLIDVSLLEPPEPLEKILDALADLPPGDHLRVKHRRDPVPLYRMLRDMGYEWATTQLAPSRFEIVIWPSDMPAPIRDNPRDLNNP
jgi:uncharacterized protein (DUF2249 family)